MSDLFRQARVIGDKLTKTQDDWKEIVRLYCAAGEKRTGLSAVEIADCYNWAGMNILNHYDEKTPGTFSEALRLFTKVEDMNGLPNWYSVVDNQLLARMAPSAFGFNPATVEVGNKDLIDRLVAKMIRLKGALETANTVTRLLYTSVFNPVYIGHAKTFSENEIAVRAIDGIVSTIWDSLNRIPIGEAGFSCRGLLYHYSMPKTRASFAKAKEGYKAAIRKISLIEEGASYAFTHLIDLLERPAFHGFGECVDSTETMLEALELRAQRDKWQNSDPSRRAKYWEMQLIVNQDWGRGIIGLHQCTPESLERAISLGEAVLEESNSNLIKALAAAMLGWIYLHRMPATKDNTRSALKYFRIALEVDPNADGTIATDFTFVNMSRADLVRANTAKLDAYLRKILQIALSLCYFPEKSACKDLPQAEMDAFKAFLSTHTTAVPGVQASELIAKVYPEYMAFVDRLHAMTAKSKPAVRRDLFVLGKAEEVGASILENAGKTGGAEKVKEKELELKNTAELVESFYKDVAMAQFYIGFTRTFSEIYVSSMAISSGTIATDTDNLAITAASFLLSMVPLIGNVAPTLLECGYNQYASVKLESSAEMMVTTFPQDALMTDVVLKVLQEVHNECLSELNELDIHSDKIMLGLLAKLSGKLEFLKGLIAKQRNKSELEKLAAQVAMDVIEQQIFSGRLPRYSSPSQTTQHLMTETVKTLLEVHTSREEIIENSSKSSSPAGQAKPAPTPAPAPEPILFSVKDESTKESVRTPSTAPTSVHLSSVSTEMKDTKTKSCRCVIS